jgi:mRNA interferase RelE/StbE
MASYKIEWKNSAYKELQKLPHPMISRVIAAISDLSNEPRPQGGKKLVGSGVAIVYVSGIIASYMKFLRIDWLL